MNRRDPSLDETLRGAIFAVVLALGTASPSEAQEPGRAPRIAIDTAGIQVVTSDPLNSDSYCSTDRGSGREACGRPNRETPEAGVLPTRRGDPLGHSTHNGLAGHGSHRYCC